MCFVLKEWTLICKVRVKCKALITFWYWELDSNDIYWVAYKFYTHFICALEIRKKKQHEYRDVCVMNGFILQYELHWKQNWIAPKQYFHIFVCALVWEDFFSLISANSLWIRELQRKWYILSALKFGHFLSHKHFG